VVSGHIEWYALRCENIFLTETEVQTCFRRFFNLLPSSLPDSSNAYVRGPWRKEHNLEGAQSTGEKTGGQWSEPGSPDSDWLEI
jgi:hypothetical protein